MKKILFILSMLCSLFATQEITSCKNHHKQTICLHELINLPEKEAYDLSRKLCFDEDSAGACIAIIKNPITQTMPKQERIELINKAGDKICSLQAAAIAGDNSHKFCLPVAHLALSQNDTQKAAVYSKNGCKANDEKACKLYTKITGEKIPTKQEKIKELKAKAAKLMKIAKKTKDPDKVYRLRKEAESYLDIAIILQTSGDAPTDFELY